MNAVFYLILGLVGSGYLFSKDGKKRYFIKSSIDLSLAKELGNEIGELLKKKSKGSYK